MTSDTPRSEPLTPEEEADLRAELERGQTASVPYLWLRVRRLVATLDAERAARQPAAPEPECIGCLMVARPDCPKHGTTYAEYVARQPAADIRTWAERHGWPPGSRRDEWNDSEPRQPAADTSGLRAAALAVEPDPFFPDQQTGDFDWEGYRDALIAALSGATPEATAPESLVQHCHPLDMECVCPDCPARLTEQQGSGS